ncbi:hypothetical protein [Microbispora sp. H13382]|uniref:hypothetical protein n=1 Tax=Microbispora sp. H13382 TaxID=2729112 RepID=UPI0021761CA7|nr:hypothetical protein [Microbispora sp. H13382]
MSTSLPSSSIDEGEQGRGDLPAQPPDHLVGRRLLIQPLKGRPGLGSHLRGLRERQLGRAVGVDVLEHDAVVPDQRLGDLPLGEPNLLQLRLGLLDLRGDALAEHRRHVVTDAHPGPVDQARDQREALDGRVVPKRRGVPGIRLPGEVGDLPCGDAVHPHRAITEAVQPLHALGQVLEV